MKIIFLIRSLNHGGAEHMLVDLACGLHRRGRPVLVAVFYADGPLEKELREAGVPVAVLDKKGRWDVVPFLWRLVKLMRRERPGCLHGYLPVPNLIAILLKPLFPKTRMVWEIAASNMDLSHYDWLARLIFKAQCFFSRFADLIIVNSHAGRDYHKQHGFPDKKMIVIPQGIDTERFKPDAAARAIVRAEWGIGQNEILIGLVARLDPMKDHPTFLRAAAALAKERGDIRFVCVGTGPVDYTAMLKGLSKKLGLDDRLIWAGRHNDIPAVFNALDVAALSSISEGLPNVIIEGMSCGAPFVSTDVGDAAWVIGDTGIIVPPGNPDALAKGWLALLAGDMDKAKANARRRIVENFSLERFIISTEKVL